MGKHHLKISCGSKGRPKPLLHPRGCYSCVRHRGGSIFFKSRMYSLRERKFLRETEGIPDVVAKDQRRFLISGISQMRKCGCQWMSWWRLSCCLWRCQCQVPSFGELWAIPRPPSVFMKPVCFKSKLTEEQKDPRTWEGSTYSSAPFSAEVFCSLKPRGCHPHFWNLVYPHQIHSCWHSQAHHSSINQSRNTQSISIYTEVGLKPSIQL